MGTWVLNTPHKAGGVLQAYEIRALPAEAGRCSPSATRREPLRPGGGARSRARPDPGRGA